MNIYSGPKYLMGNYKLCIHQKTNEVGSGEKLSWMFVPKYSSFVSSKWKISRSSFVALSRYCSPLDLTNKTVIRNSLRCRRPPLRRDKMMLRSVRKITLNLCMDKLKIFQSRRPGLAWQGMRK